MRTTALALVLTLGACKRELTPEPGDPTYHFAFDEALASRIEAVSQGDSQRLWVALDGDFARRDGERGVWSFVSRGDLPLGEITFLGTIDGSREWLIAHVHGKGIFRSWAESGVWERVDLRSPLLEVLRPGAVPIPTDLAQADDVAWLSTIGGVFFSADEGVSWELADTSTSGNANAIYTGLDVDGDQLIAVSVLPEALIPANFAGVLSGRVFFSENNGITWQSLDGDFPSNYPTSVSFGDNGTLWVGTMDQGVVRGDRNGVWTPLFGPTDVVDLEWVDGGLSAASATRGLWRLEDDVWSQTGTSPGVAIRGRTGLLRGGEVHLLEQGEGEVAAPPSNGRVFVNLSFHVNYYHSYRGDSNTEDGFGKDIRIITTILDWLDTHPEVQADWDLDNAFTTDDWMVEHSPELIARIRERVDNGQDDVRLMSWNNGAMASSSEEEFIESIQRAKASNETHFGDWVPGVQPQENMLSPDHLSWYRDRGIDWITLFYSANGFTGPRNDIRLEGAAAHNPFVLRDPIGQGFMTGVPVYHHGDLLDHGGLAGWARQLNAAYDQDTLLVIHFDADADSWETFDRELDAIAELPFVEYTTIRDYLDDHGTLTEVDLPGDVADGIGDGFASWAEKTVNQEVFTDVVAARFLADVARLVGAGDPATVSALEASLPSRLLALSTTNYGLAAPELHPDRELSARQLANDAKVQAALALQVASESAPLEPGELEVVNPLDVSGVAIIPFKLRMPQGVWEGETGLVIDRSGTPLPLRAAFSQQFGDEDLIDVVIQMDVPANSRTRLTWRYDPADPLHAVGSLTLADAPALPILKRPMAECFGEPPGLASGGPMATDLDVWGLRVSTFETWVLPTCNGAVTQVTRQISRFDSYPGFIVQAQANIAVNDNPAEMLSLALTPYECPGGVDTLEWKTFGGRIRTRGVPETFETWNPVSADGWFAVVCGDGSRLQIAVDTGVRTSMGMLSMRNDPEVGLLAPLGTLWGDSPWHDAQRTGGTGMSDLVIPLLGSQFRPAAPEWSGKSVDVRMWVTTDTSFEQLELFAHPPHVRVPPAQTP